MDHFEEDLANCHFVPMSTMRRLKNFLDNRPSETNKKCKTNLVELQNRNIFKRKSWETQYQLAIKKAVYSHDWNKVVILLTKSPIWEHDSYKFYGGVDFYIRAMTLVLMNHPNAKSQGLFNDYLHMVLACRSNEDKKAMLKVILSLPEKLIYMKKKGDCDL